MKPIHRIYVSPHLDDAVLSCGASIAQQAAGGDVVQVLTVAAGRPADGSLSAYAQQLHAAAGDPADMTAARWCEDEAACALLGASPCHLDYLDAPYRTDPVGGEFLYTSDSQLLGGQVHPADEALIGDLAASIAQRVRSAETLLYAPLGAGGHVDHLLVRDAALQLQRDGHTVQFYEDYPYVEDGHRLVEALARPVRYGCGWEMAALSWVARQHVEMKIQAIAMYSSQIGVLFGDAQQMAERVAAYMLLVGGGERFAERFWTRCAPATLAPADHGRRGG